MGELGDLWRGVLLALKDRKGSNRVKREEAMLVPSGCRLQGARTTMQAYQGKEGSLEVWTWGKEDCICLYADGPESGENPRKKNPFISLRFRNSSGHLSRHDLLVQG